MLLELRVFVVVTAETIRFESIIWVNLVSR